MDVGVCDTCDNDVKVHEGPVVTARGLYEVREIAQALVEVGRGLTYTDAARRVRTGYWGPDGTGRLHGDASGQTVADWVGQFAPVLGDEMDEKEWPETLVLDSTEFQWTNPRTGTPQQLFCVLAAWGYPAGDPKGRLWRVEARPTDRNTHWEAFLGALEGKPTSVVCDRDLAIIGGVQRRWGKSGKKAVPIHQCEHHLYINARKALGKDDISKFGHPTLEALKDAFKSPAGWEGFAAAVNADPSATNGQRWVKHWDRRMRVQTQRRSTLPPHYSTGALEPRIRDVRQMLERRRWTFRNRDRMNQLLGLARLRLNRQDDPRAYAAILRQHLDDNGGKPARSRRSLHDRRGDYSLRP